MVAAHARTCGFPCRLRPLFNCHRDAFWQPLGLHGLQVTPKNELERLFNVVVIMSAMVIFSTFISAITNAMNQLRNLNSSPAEHLCRRVPA